MKEKEDQLTSKKSGMKERGHKKGNVHTLVVYESNYIYLFICSIIVCCPEGVSYNSVIGICAQTMNYIRLWKQCDACTVHIPLPPVYRKTTGLAD